MPRVIKNLYGRKSKAGHSEQPPTSSFEGGEATESACQQRRRRAPMGTLHYPDQPATTQLPTLSSSLEGSPPSESPAGDNSPTQIDSRPVALPNSSGMSDAPSGSSTTDPRILLTFHATTGAMLLVNDVSRTFIKLFDRKWFPNGYQWAALTETEKRFYYDEFKKRFRWECGDEVVYTKFCKRAAQRYKDIMCDIRGGKVRDTVEAEILQAWQEKWNEPQYEHRRQINSKNCRPEHVPGVGMSTHTCGSHSMLGHVDVMTKDSGGRMPSAFDLFKKIHTKKNERGEIVYACKKAEEVVDEYHQGMKTEQSQGNNSQADGNDESSKAPQVDPNEVFYKIVKGKTKKKQKVYGLGPCASQHYSDSLTDTGATTKASGYDQAAIEKIKEELDQQYATKLQNEVESIKKTLEDYMQQKFQSMFMHGPPPPWAYPPPSHGATGYWSGPSTGMGAAGSSSGQPASPWWGGPSSAGAVAGSSGPPTGPWWGGPPSGAGATGGSSGPPTSLWLSGPPGWWSTTTPAPKDNQIVGVSGDGGADIDVGANVDAENVDP